MTRTELETALHQIGWRIHQSHNGLNDFIINHFGEETAWCVNGDHLELRVDTFGSDTNLGRGSVHFEIRNMRITIDERNPPHWVAIHFNVTGDIFIQFFNHRR